MGCCGCGRLHESPARDRDDPIVYTSRPARPSEPSHANGGRTGVNTGEDLLFKSETGTQVVAVTVAGSTQANVQSVVFGKGGEIPKEVKAAMEENAKLLRELIATNPQVKAIAEANPQVQKFLDDPEHFGQ